MCSIQAAGMAINVGSKVMQHQADMMKYRHSAHSNFIAKQNASKSYLDDIGQVDYQLQKAAEEKTREKYKAKIAKISSIAEALNMNAGNANAIFKDIGAAASMDMVDVDAAFNQDIVSLMRKEQEAFGSYQKTINNLPIPVKPSMMGLALNLAGAGLQYKKDEYEYGVS
tara:strand:- start:1409 stop:1915 length:507 start_codon:yes stop_codon:yes gene_type:complete